MTPLETAIRELAEARFNQELRSQHVMKLLSDFRVENANSLEEELSAKTAVTESTAKVRALALEAFAADPTNQREDRYQIAGS